MRDAPRTLWLRMCVERKRNCVDLNVIFIQRDTQHTLEYRNIIVFSVVFSVDFFLLLSSSSQMTELSTPSSISNCIMWFFWFQFFFLLVAAIVIASPVIQSFTWNECVRLVWIAVKVKEKRKYKTKSLLGSFFRWFFCFLFRSLVICLFHFVAGRNNHKIS